MYRFLTFLFIKNNHHVSLSLQALSRYCVSQASLLGIYPFKWVVITPWYQMHTHLFLGFVFMANLAVGRNWMRWCHARENLERVFKPLQPLVYTISKDFDLKIRNKFWLSGHSHRTQRHVSWASVLGICSLQLSGNCIPAPYTAVSCTRVSDARGSPGWLRWVRWTRTRGSWGSVWSVRCSDGRSCCSFVSTRDRICGTGTSSPGTCLSKWCQAPCRYHSVQHKDKPEDIRWHMLFICL